MTEVAATLNKLSYQYPRSQTLALKDISLEVPQGEFLGLIGPSGAGKTTLCLSFNGVIPQFYGGRFWGKITVGGLDTLEHSISTLAQHVGMVFEDPETQITAMSVENEIAFALENLAIPRAEMRVRISRVLTITRLEGMEKKHPHELSGGQKQRLAIASALAVQPELLVLDEPTSQLDPVGKQEIFSTLRELNRDLGMTIIMASQDAEELAEYASRIVLLSRGEVVASGSSEDIYGDIPLLDRYKVRPPEVARTFYLIHKKAGLDAPIPVKLDDGLNALQSRSRPAVSRCNVPPLPSEQTLDRGSPLISVRDLCHVYPDGTEALQEVSMDIHQGEYLLIAGHNGAGKSTLVKHFLGLLHPTSGEVWVADNPTNRWTTSALAHHIGYVSQNPDTQLFTTTVWDEVAFALKALGYPSADIQMRVTESLSTLNLLERQKAHPLSLPKGDRARLVIAAVLAMRPEVIVLDEPMLAQDFADARVILDMTKVLHAAGKTIIVITHQLYWMPGYAQRVVVMGEGRILMDAPLREALHAVEILHSTFLAPPQAVLLAQAFGAESLLLTPEEVANCVTQSIGTGVL